MQTTATNGHKKPVLKKPVKRKKPIPADSDTVDLTLADPAQMIDLLPPNVVEISLDVAFSLQDNASCREIREASNEVHRKHRSQKEMSVIRKRLIQIDLRGPSWTMLSNMMMWLGVPERVRLKVKAFLLAGTPLETKVQCVGELVDKLNWHMWQRQQRSEKVMRTDEDGVPISDEMVFMVPKFGNLYPLVIQANCHTSIFGSYAGLSAQIQLCDLTEQIFIRLRDSLFENANGQSVQRAPLDVLEELGIRLTTPTDLAEFSQKMKRWGELHDKHGTVVETTNSVFSRSERFWGSSVVEQPACYRRLIVEHALQASGNARTSAAAQLLPMIRAFSMDLKEYVYADVDSVKEYEFDRNANQRLAINSEDRAVLDAVFATSPDKVFGDIFRGRHGGAVIMAHGGPGVGKTLTAEVYSEVMERPLYVMELGELGTNLAGVEENLRIIFERARRWNAVLLFDEADIFLATRGDDLERSAIVGVFLRLLDSYQGTLFLTTNRIEAIDPAFKSRVTLTLGYPALTHERRREVWSHLLSAAKLETDPRTLDDVSSRNYNGRNARNAVRLIKMLFPNVQHLGLGHFEQALKYIAT